MLRFTIISLALLACAANVNVYANLFDSLLGENENNHNKNEKVIVKDPEAQQSSENQETGLAIIGNNEPLSETVMKDLISEGQSGVVIRAKRYYGCGCGCCGCATMAPAATMMPCGCGCCGCGYGK